MFCLEFITECFRQPHGLPNWSSWVSLFLMIRWMPIPTLLLLQMILAGCAADSAVVYRSPSNYYYPYYSPHHYDSHNHYGRWPMYPDYPNWRGREISPLPMKNIDDLSAEEMRRTVDTVNLINLYNSDPNRSWLWWDQRRIRVTPSP